MNVDVDMYQVFTDTTAIYPREVEEQYLLAGLFEELGELAGAFKKYHRGDYDVRELDRRLLGEAGDVIWYLARILKMRGISISHVMNNNMDKLLARKKGGVLKGDGDDR